MQFPRSFAGGFLLSAVIASGACADAVVVVSSAQSVLAANAISAPASRESPFRTVSLAVDFASVLQIDGEMSAIAVGKSEIVDASLANEQTIILTGRMVGTTNLIALDDKGGVIANVMVHVSAQKPGMVTVRRGVQLQSYNCGAGLCEDVKSTGTATISADVPES